MYTIIGFNPLIIKIAIQEVPPLEFLTYRLTFAFLVALVPLVLRKERLQITFRDILTLLPVMIVYAICFFTLQALSLETMPSTEFGILFAVNPIITAILASVFIKEKTNSMQYIFIVVSVAGVIFIFLMNGINPEVFNPRGTVLTLLTTLTMGTTVILTRRASKKYPADIITFFLTAAGFIVFNIVLVVTRVSSGTMGYYFSPLADWRFLLAVIFLGTFGMFGVAFLRSYALKYMEATKATVFSAIGTVVTIIGGGIFLSESVLWYHILGTAIILIGVIGTNLSSDDELAKRRKKRAVSQRESED
jgi:drug/metabolite transporter (DMT)-like permease